MFRSNLSSTVRTVVAAAALATSGLLLAASATPAFAGPAPAYRLAPVAALAAADTVVVRDVLWSCNETNCVARSATSRPAIVCATAARKIGELASFTANGKEFTAEELAACNAKAK
jgi:hypothetical protein